MEIHTRYGNTYDCSWINISQNIRMQLHILTLTSIQNQKENTFIEAIIIYASQILMMAQELLAKKLGEITGPTSESNIAEPGTDETNTNDEFYLQHFARPVEKVKMDAIQCIIEYGEETGHKKVNKLAPMGGSPGLLV